MAEEEKKRRRKQRKTDQLESKQTEVGKSLKELSQSKTDGSVKKKSKSKLYSRSQSKKEKKRRSVIISSNEAIPPQISEHFLIMADNSDFEEERQDENDIKFKKSKKSKNVTPSTGTVIAGVPVRVEESDLIFFGNTTKSMRQPKRKTTKSHREKSSGNGSSLLDWVKNKLRCGPAED